MRLHFFLFPVCFVAWCCASVPAPAPTVSGGCGAGIEYQGRTLDVGATWKLLGIKVRESISTVAAGASSSVVSAFGQAGYEFVIEHK